MENTVTIQPATPEIGLKLKALEHINWFISKGFTHKAFMSLVSYHFPVYKDGAPKTRLSNWWYTKIADNDINDNVEHVINCLKNE